MKRLYNPDPIQLRRKSYQQRDGELLKSLADAMSVLNDNDIDIGEKMKNELAERNKIKRRFKKGAE